MFIGIRDIYDHFCDIAASQVELLQSPQLAQTDLHHPLASLQLDHVQVEVQFQERVGQVIDALHAAEHL